MKLKKTLPLLILSTLLFLVLSSLNVNASSWKKGVPDAINSPITKPWISNKKSSTGTDSKGKKIYSVYVFITNGQFATSDRPYYLNGKPDNSIPAYWARMYTNPYYKIISKDTYRIKDKSGEGGLIIKKLSENKMKVWGKITVHSYGYFGVFTRTNFDAYSKINPSN